MSEYSIYTITDEDRQFSQSCTVVHCADDVEAIEAAAQWLDIHDIELWESPSHPFRRRLTRGAPQCWATLTSRHAMTRPSISPI